MIRLETLREIRESILCTSSRMRTKSKKRIKTMKSQRFMTMERQVITGVKLVPVI
jgi:hypothetical protein